MKISHHHSADRNEFVVKRFRQLLWGMLLLSLLSIGNIFLGSSEARSTNITVVVGIITLTFFTFYMIKTGREKLARGIFLWCMAIFLTYIVWRNGGLRDSTTLSFPILIVYSALLGSFRVFISILCYMVIAVIFLGTNSVYGWYPTPLEPISLEQVFNAVLITVFAAYVAWTVNSDMNTTFKNLSRENKKVIKSHEMIQLMAEQDPLTGLLNRHACELHYKKVLSQLSNTNERIILFFVDLDNFKNLNDSFGHKAGDELLVAISNGLKKLLLPNDAACRIGGDEFVVIIKRDNIFDIDQLANAIMKVITTPYDIAKTSMRMTGSIGIAISPEDGQEFDEIRQKADIAMYQSKQSGKNTFSYYSAHLHQEAIRKTAILKGLEGALENNLLDLHIQPKVNLATGKMNSGEALLRWNRGNSYQFAPDEFIPVIESTELIHEIGQWCIEEACRICKKWHDAGFNTMTIAVNVSSVQFMRSNFNDVVFQALQDSGLEPRFLEIELTEHVLIQHNETVKNQLKSLKDLGIQLAIDDFGTGYSNLSYLINFKVDTIKLDKSFIFKVNTSPDHLAVVKAVIQMAQILNLKVVAEGVESHAVSKILVDLQCDYAQGFLWSSALPEHQFIQTVQQFNAGRTELSALAS